MHPWLWASEGLKIPTYHAAISAGFLVATLALAREIRTSGLPARDIYDLCLPILPAAWIGARLFLIFDDPGTFFANPWLLFDPRAGWGFQGGFTLAASLVLLGARRKGLPIWAVGDVFAPILPLGITIGRLGCLGAGCCHGRPADWPLGVEVPWSVRYYVHGKAPPELLGVSLHPTPLYESMLGLVLFTALTLRHRHRAFVGEPTALLFLGYGLGRFTTEWFRGDLERGFYVDGWLSTAQVWALGMAVVGAGLYAALRR